jgi:adenylosuccinate lyase
MSLSPLSTRYASSVSDLTEIFSDTQYFIQRVRVELAYFKILLRKKNVQFEDKLIDSILDNPNQSYERFCEIDKITKHDVKAIEYFIKEKLSKDENLSKYKEFVHCGLTSQDVNSVGFTLILNNVLTYLKGEFDKFSYSLNELLKNTDIITIGYTHGQKAIPVNMSYEFSKLKDKIENTFKKITDLKLSAKFSSSTGNYTTLMIIFPDMNSIDKLYSDLNEELNSSIEFNKKARQIDDYTSYTEFLSLIETLAMNMKEFCLNVWLKIHRNELIQQKKEGEIGSSVMSHKINPWRLEQAEAISNLIISMSRGIRDTISISKDSRDMSDSYALRYVGEVVGNITLLLKNVSNDIISLKPNEKLIKEILNDSYSSLSEYIQTYLKWNYPEIKDPYKLLENLTKGKNITKPQLDEFIDSLQINQAHKECLKEIKIENYIGMQLVA